MQKKARQILPLMERHRKTRVDRTLQLHTRVLLTPLIYLPRGQSCKQMHMGIFNDKVQRAWQGQGLTERRQ